MLKFFTGTFTGLAAALASQALFATEHDAHIAAILMCGALSIACVCFVGAHYSNRR